MCYCDVFGMMYVKEDLIMFLDLIFYEFIMIKVCGKFGLLFRFDVKDDVRFRGGVNVEVENFYFGKVIFCFWYDKNKFMFLVNCWEVFECGKLYVEEGYWIK